MDLIFVRVDPISDKVDPVSNVGDPSVDPTSTISIQSFSGTVEKL